APVRSQDVRALVGRAPRVGPVPEAIHHAQQRLRRARDDQVQVARLEPVERALRHPPLEPRRRARELVRVRHRSHFFIVTVVPALGADTSSNSSIRRLAPGSPSPRLLPVEKPSRIASSASGMPGPLSVATTTMPGRPSRSARLSTTSPRSAYL